MYLHIFGNFRDPSRLPKVKTLVSDVVIPRSELEKETLETILKLFYSKGDDPSSIETQLLANGFICIDSAPYTMINHTRTKYKRQLKEKLSAKDFLDRRFDLENANVEFNNNFFEIYETIPSGIEKIQTKSYYGDRMIFKLK